VQKKISFIFLSLLLLFDSVYALDILTGQVRSIDKENNILVIAPTNNPSQSLTIQFDKARLPSNLKQGDTLMIKGYFKNVDNTSILKSPKIWCSRTDRHNFDKSGVRRRLFQGRKQGRGFQHRGGGVRAHGRH